MKRILTITSVLAMFASLSVAQNTDAGARESLLYRAESGARNGTAGASQLLIPQGAKYLTGGGAVATATGVGATYWNPAGIARTKSAVETSFSNRSYFADMSVSFFGAVLKAGSNAFGVNVRTVDIGEIDVTTVFSPDGTGEKFTPSNFTAGFTYARMMSSRTSMGMSLNLTSEGFRRVQGRGITIDAGVQYSDFLNVSGLDVGVVVRNFGQPMRYDGSGLLRDAIALGTDRQTTKYKVEAAKFDMPLVMEIGTKYNMSTNISLAGTYEVNNFDQDKIKLTGTFNIPGLLAVRTGYLLNVQSVDIQDNVTTENVDESESSLENIFGGLSFGGSLSLQRTLGINASIDYAYIPVKHFDGNTVFTLNVGF
ncbi:MAG: PorV/PorQ family protein [Candidatus Marinimicrobia bacterium]|nr:PorV/PorQ family protein [Candidatus Neomarinimicrobiota bacterium]